MQALGVALFILGLAVMALGAPIIGTRLAVLVGVAVLTFGVVVFVSTPKPPDDDRG